MSQDQLDAKQVDVLLAAYKAIKDEITRRSALTWTTVGGYLVFIFGAFKAIIDLNTNRSDWKILVWAGSSWLVAILTYLFYVRENKEIVDRLSDNIKCDIEKRLRELFKLPSLSDPLLLERYDRRKVLVDTRRLQIISDWAVFFGAPLEVTLLAAHQLAMPVVHLAVYIFFSMVGVVLACLLVHYGKWRTSPADAASEQNIS